MNKVIIHQLRCGDEWNRLWKREKSLKQFKMNSLFALRFDRLMKKHLEKGRKLLEIGCGGGKFLTYFNEQFDCEVYGIDYSPAGCELAKKNLESAGIKGTIICDDIFNCTQLEKESFDIVFSGGFIEHFDETETVIAKHIEFLKPGGTLVIELPNMLGFHGYVFKTFNRDSFYSHKSLTAKMVEQYFSNLGIQVKESAYIGSLKLESGDKPGYLQLFFCMVNKIIYWVLRTLNISFESENVSAYIIVIGKKPLNN